MPSYHGIVPIQSTRDQAEPISDDENDDSESGGSEGEPEDLPELGTPTASGDVQRVASQDSKTIYGPS